MLILQVQVRSMGYSNTEKQRIEVMNETLEQITARATAEAESIYPYTGSLATNVNRERMREAYIKGVIAEATRENWISSDQMMPNDDELVVCFHAKYSRVFTACVHRMFGPNEPETYWVDVCGTHRDVTHWQPLPTPPSK